VTLRETEGQTRLGGRFLVGLIAIFFAGASFIIEVTATNIVLPSLSDINGLAASPAAISWIVSGGSVALAVALIPAGRLGDVFGRRLLFVGGASLYAASGLIASLVGSATLVAAFRLIHGMGGGLMIAGAFALIQVMFVGNARIKAIAYYTAMTGAMALLGPIVAGWLLDGVGLIDGWRWVLAAGAPFAIVAAVLGQAFLPKAKGAVDGGYDVIGAVLLVAALIGLMVPVISISDAALPSWADLGGDSSPDPALRALAASHRPSWWDGSCAPAPFQEPTVRDQHRERAPRFRLHWCGVLPCHGNHLAVFTRRDRPRCGTGNPPVFTWRISRGSSE
jgi:MFS family permease